MTDFDSSSTANIAWVKMYAGTLEVRISLPVISVDGEVTAPAASRLLASIANLKAAGFAENPAGVEPGQMVEEMSGVLVRQQVNDDDTITPVVYFYSSNERLVNKYLHAYLDTEDERKDFERASGLTLTKMAVWNQNAAPTRDDRKADGFIYKTAPFKVIYEPNPRYVEGDKKHAKLQLVGYVGSVPNAKPVAGQPQAQPAGSEPELTVVSHDKPAQPKGKLNTALLLSLTGGLFSADDHAFNAFGKLTKAGTLTTKMSVDDQLAAIQADRLRSWGEKEATNTLYVVSAKAAEELDSSTTIRWRKLILTPTHAVYPEGKVNFDTVDPDGALAMITLPPNALLIAQNKDIPFD